VLPNIIATNLDEGFKIRVLGPNQNDLLHQTNGIVTSRLLEVGRKT